MMQQPARSASQLRRIEAMIVTNLKPVRPLAPPRILLFACSAVLLGTVTVGAMPFALGGWWAMTIAQRFAIFSALTASAALLSISIVGHMAPGSRHSFASARVPNAILCALLLLIAAAFRPRTDHAFLTNGITCLIIGVACAVPAALLLGLIARRGALLCPRLAGAAIGGLAGLGGLIVLELNCSNLNVFHVLTWHWGVALIGTIAGALLGAAKKFASAHNFFRKASEL
jgi:hypothetical protein